eukprot:Pgem_evm1s14680
MKYLIGLAICLGVVPDAYTRALPQDVETFKHNNHLDRSDNEEEDDDEENPNIYIHGVGKMRNPQQTHVKAERRSSTESFGSRRDSFSSRRDSFVDRRSSIDSFNDVHKNYFGEQKKMDEEFAKKYEIDLT